MNEIQAEKRYSIDLYSHHFSVRVRLRTDINICRQFAKKMGQWGSIRVGPGKFKRGIVRVYAFFTKNRREFRFHISQYDEFLDHLDMYAVSKGDLEVEAHDPPIPEPATFNYIDVRTPRDYQAPIIDYIVDDGNMKIVELDPGRGKTFISLTAIKRLKVRTFICIKAQYIEQWIKAIKESYELRPGELYVIQGANSLRNLFELADAGEMDANFIICSNTTFNIYLKEYYETSGDMYENGWLVNPPDMWELLKIGLKVVDESHETLHFNYRLTMVTNVMKTLDLSATLLHEDPFIKKVQDTLHPQEIRYREEERKVHCKAEAVFYSIDNVDKRVKYTNFALKSYNHVRFEQSMMKNKKMWNGYMEMINDLIVESFIKVKQPNQRSAIYFATKDACTAFTKFMQEKHSDMNIQRYIGEDAYDDMLKADIIVTTLKSLGTAIDVPGLRVALVTVALGSSQLNIQVMGRLRPLKEYPDTDPEFMFLVCKDIPKHISYYEKKRELFRGRVIDPGVTDYDTGIVL